MDFSRQSFVTVNEILADVLKIVKDSSFKVNSRGFYVSQIQQALEELSFDTYFDERSEVFEVPADLRLDMPKGAFNLKNMYLFNGTECDISRSQNVYWKRNFINSKSGNGFVAKDRLDNHNDPFHRDRFRGATNRLGRDNNLTGVGGVNELFFFNVQQGVIMLSESCRKFGKILIEFNGMGADIGDLPVIPNMLRQAVKDYVSEAGLDTRIADAEGVEFNKWSTIQAKITSRKDKPFDGSWAKAEHRVSALSNKQRQDFKEYLARMNY